MEWNEGENNDIIIAEVEKVFCEISDKLNIQNFSALQNSSATGFMNVWTSSGT